MTNERYRLNWDASIQAMNTLNRKWAREIVKRPFVTLKDSDLKMQQTEKAHAEFNASGSARWLACPGSIALSKLAPEPVSSKYAEEGTTAHIVLEYLLSDKSLREILNGSLPDISDEMTKHAQSARDWIKGRLRELGEGCDFLCETKVDASSFTCTGQFGTLDAAIVQHFGRLIVIDYKYGAGLAVDPIDDEGNLNSQLVYYALGVSALYDHNFSEVELVIIQPRAYHPSGETIRSVVVSMDELLAWIPRFRNGVMATSDPKAPLKAGKWCKFCPAALICPEIKVKAFKEAQVVFSDEKGIESLPAPTMITLPHLGTIVAATYKLEEWIGKVREHAEQVLERGGEVPGFKLVQKRAQRKWRDGEEVVGIEADRDWGHRAFSDPRPLSPTQMEKVTGKDWVDQRTVSESSGTTLVPDSDKRPSVTPAKVVFAAAPLLDSPKKRK